jgi:tRNA A-37 threonylcarbamoyl transferase component Bud32
MSAVVHPDLEQLKSYALGKLPLNQIPPLETHLAGCKECRAQAESLDGCSDSFVAGLRGATDAALDDAELNRLVDSARTLTRPSLNAAPTAAWIVAGHEIIRELARGGLGVVYLARHPLLGDLRAIKRPLTRDGFDRDMLLARFRREVQVVGALRHDHIIRAHDAGADNEGPYLVMEYLDGQPLSRLRTRQGQLPVPQACELIRQAALGLQAAHELGLIHRDVKPSNLILARANSGARVVVIDWGLAKRSNESAPVGGGLTGTGIGMGTADYIAPEQIHDARAVDIRADVYSLGATFYDLLTGRSPFHGKPELEKLLAHQREEFPALDRVRSDVPREVVAVLKRMVAKEPSQRWPTPGEAARELQPFCCGAESRALLALLEPMEGKEPGPAQETRDVLQMDTEPAAPLAASGLAAARKQAGQEIGLRPKPILYAKPAPAPRRRLGCGLAAAVVVLLAVAGGVLLVAVAGGLAWKAGLFAKAPNPPDPLANDKDNDKPNVQTKPVGPRLLVNEDFRDALKAGLQVPAGWEKDAPFRIVSENDKPCLQVSPKTGTHFIGVPLSTPLTGDFSIEGECYMGSIFGGGHTLTIQLEDSKSGATHSVEVDQGGSGKIAGKTFIATPAFKTFSLVPFVVKREDKLLRVRLFNENAASEPLGVVPYDTLRIGMFAGGSGLMKLYKFRAEAN